MVGWRTSVPSTAISQAPSDTMPHGLSRHRSLSSGLDEGHSSLIEKNVRTIGSGPCRPTTSTTARRSMLGHDENTPIPASIAAYPPTWRNVMDEKVLEAILVQLARLNKSVEHLTDKVERFVVDLGEFSERFDEVVTQLEGERRLDTFGLDEDD